jgi:hypothetical protein
MDNASTQVTAQPPIAAVAPALPAPLAVPSVRKTGGLGHKVYNVLKQIASLRLTVVLFVLSIVLVFCGTLAQVDAGIWTVVAKYFRSLYVWIPFQIFFPRAMKIGGGFPFPGGWLLGAVLLLNLLAAHAVRFKMSWKRSGILTIHAGLIVIMVSELVTGLFAAEGTMMIYEGQSSNYTMNLRETELAVTRTGDSATADVVVVPMAMLRRTDGVIKNDALPFDVEIVQYMVNSRLCRLKPPELTPVEYASFPAAPTDVKNPATAGEGLKSYLAIDLPESGGVEQGKEDQAAAYVRFRKKGTGEDLGTYLLAVPLQDEPQYVLVDGQQYDVRLRLQRTYKPYTVHLNKFSHDYYPGTDLPKNFSSEVRLMDPTRNENREVKISMNNPLRYGGETFYQQSFEVKQTGQQITALQVVRNPGWLMPYISCVMVATGMLIHFGLHLTNFLGRRAVP